MACGGKLTCDVRNITVQANPDIAGYGVRSLPTPHNAFSAILRVSKLIPQLLKGPYLIRTISLADHQRRHICILFRFCG